MFNSKIKSIVFFIVCVVLLFGLSLGIGLFIRSLVREPDKKVNETDVVLIADTDTFTMNNKFSVSDEFGSKIKDSNGGTFVYYPFVLSNRTSEDRDYELYITQEFDDNNSFNVNYLKFYLTSGDDFGLNVTSITDIPSYDKLPYLVDKPGSKLLYSGRITKNCTSNLVLRVWLSNNYIPPVEEGTVKFEIHVRAI